MAMKRAPFAIAMAMKYITYKTFTYSVSDGEKAVIFDRFRGVLDTPVGEGYHVYNPLVQKPHIFTTRVMKHELSSIYLTKDMQRVKLEVGILYRPSELGLTSIFRLLGPDYAAKVLPSIGEDVVAATVAQFDGVELTTESSRVFAILKQELTERAGEFDIVLDDVSVVKLLYVYKLSEAIEGKLVAQVDVERAKLEVIKSEEEGKAALIAVERIFER